ncbi:unnamed protein product [Peronospora belbahrii]|uniref:Cysteine/serine-rich nuclear protein N-terminal domain-containing protein n=1 Tax=Peronospora belbahrii TaxID=622444 RepID=A0AAU9KQF9_9STRA|nr:unnamed protein product [Peronospora belbahrii]
MNETATIKCVRWSTITVYEFGVTLGGSAVPRRGGPSIGLARKPQHVWSTTLEKDTADYKNDRRKRRVQRARRVRWLKPLERITMLTKAGCSEKRIYRMMMESSDIAMSRRLCISMQRQVAV